MDNCSKNAKPIAEALRAINKAFDNQIWAEDEMVSVSKKIACNPLRELGDILQIAVGNPTNRMLNKIRRDPIELSYVNNTNDSDNLHSYRVNGLDKVNAITFENNHVKANVDQRLNKPHFQESFQLSNLDDVDSKDSLRAYAVYPDNSTTTVSSVPYAWYTVVGDNGVFEGATRVKIEFNKDRTRKVFVHFD